MNKIKRTLGFILSHPLASRHLLKSLSRFILWQLQTAISPQKLHVKKFVASTRFYARKGLTGVTGNIYTGLHEFNDMAFLLHVLTPDDLFFDIGANVGSYTLLASGVKGAKSISLEPVLSTFNILKQNVSLNNIQSITTVINSGAGSAAGSILFTGDEDTTNHVLSDIEKSNNTIEVEIITVDSLLREQHPTLIKIDVEGYETEVLKGMANTLESGSLKAIIIELNGSGERYGYNELNIHHLLLSHGFLPFDYDPFSRQLKQLDSYNNYNTIYCRDVGFINKRLKSASVTKVMGEII